MKNSVSVIEVKIRIDPVSGWGNNPQNHVNLLQNILNTAIPHYNPKVKLICVEEEKE